MSNQELMDKGRQYVMNTYGRFPLGLVKGRGIYAWDADGKQYLDFCGGIAVDILGHCPEELVKELHKQAQILWHVSNLYWIQPQVELAEKLVNIAQLDKAFFCNSGAEANEAAFKLARKYHYRHGYPERHEIICFRESFHGRTLAAVAATGQMKYQEGFAPLPPGFLFAEFNNLDSVRDLVSENTAAILIEPIQGESGIHPCDKKFLQALRRLCDDQGLLLIFDEVQCGMGRTGRFFAFQSFGVKPDIVTMAKGLGGGFPIGAMLANAQAVKGFEPGDHASTFGGNPLATAVASRVVDIVSAPSFLDNVENMGNLLMEGLIRLHDPRIVDVRGRGLMLAAEFDREVKDLIAMCMKKGLLLVNAGPNTVRFVPPLNIDENEVNRALDLFQYSLQDWK